MKGGRLGEVRCAVKTRRGIRKNLADSFALFGAGEVSGLDCAAEVDLAVVAGE
jgi:hypothetical protein